MSAPLIGLTTSRLLNSSGIPIIAATEAYIQAVLKAGGIPVLIPVGLPDSLLADLSTSLDGLLLTGGGDIDPARFDGQAHPAIYDIDPDRDQLEVSLVTAAGQTGLPFLGICRGLQLVNVAFGGSLYTDIADQYPDPLKHDYFPGYPRTYLAHPVQVKAESRLAEILGGPVLQVNSLHHQGVERPATGLQVSALAPDGLVEGLELPGHPFGLAVQWHPEWMQEHASMQALFRAFIAAASAHTPRG